MAGPRVGERYELRRRLDQREGIVVFEGWDSEQNQPVQILLLRVSGQGGDEQLRLLQFARLAGQAGIEPPPPLPAILASGSNPSPDGSGEILYYLIADWVEGPTLEAQLPLDPEQAVAVVRDLSEALQWARQRFGSGAPRYDLDPAHLVMVDERVRVTTFAPPSSEPESEQADIASLGQLLRSLLAGGASEATRKLSASQALALAQVIGRSTGPQANRYASFAEFGEALMQALAGRPTPPPAATAAVNSVGSLVRRPPTGPLPAAPTGPLPPNAAERANPLPLDEPAPAPPTAPPAMAASLPPVELPPLDVSEIEPFNPNDAFAPHPFEVAPEVYTPSNQPAEQMTTNLVAEASFTAAAPSAADSPRVTVITAADFEGAATVPTGTRNTSFGDDRFSQLAEPKSGDKPIQIGPMRRNVGAGTRTVGRTGADGSIPTGELIVAGLRPQGRTAGLGRFRAGRRLPWLLGGGLLAVLLLLLLLPNRGSNSTPAAGNALLQATATAQAVISQTVAARASATSLIAASTSTADLIANLPATDTPAPPPTDTPLPEPTPCPISFSDVPPSDVDYPSIYAVACREIIFAPNGGAFEKDRAVTRAEMAHALVTALNLPEGNPAVLEAVSDIDETTPYYKDIIAIIANGGMTGAGGKFNPNLRLTRIQAIAAIARTNQWEDEPGPGAPHYSDVPPTELLYKFVERAYNRNVISGGGDLRKNEPATRKDVALMIFNMLQSANQ